MTVYPPTLWMLPMDGTTVADLAVWAGVLDEGETARAARFHRPADRDHYIAAHALVRGLLSTRVPAVPPAAWRWQVPDPLGKPVPVLPGDAPPRAAPDANLCHCSGLVAAVAAEGAAVGVDAEPASRQTLEDGLIAQILSPAEAAALPPVGAARQAAVLRHWVRKEAAAKALGLGLSLPFATIATGGACDAPVLHTPDGRALAVRDVDAGPRHLLSVAVVDGAPGLPGLIVRRLDPPALTAALTR